MNPKHSVGQVEQEVQALRSTLAREERISRALQEVGNALGTTLELDDLLELILGRLNEVLDAGRSILYLLDETRGDLVSRFIIGGQIKSIRVKVGRGIAGTVAETGRAIRVKDAYRDQRFEREWDLLTGYKTTSMLAVPLKNHLGRTIGVIQVLNKVNGQEFSVEDEAILSALSTQAAVAIDNSRLFLSLIQKNKQLLDTKDQLERRVKELQLLFDLERSMREASSTEDLVRVALGAAAPACDARAAALLISEDDSGDLMHYLYDQDSPGNIQIFGAKTGEGFGAVAMSENRVIEARSRGDLGPLSPRVEGRFGFSIESALAMPLESHDRPVGAIVLFNKRESRSFDAEDIKLLQLICSNVATAVGLFRANEARETSARLSAIGRLLSQVIHDFKTPLTVISGYVQLLENTEDQVLRSTYTAKILKQFDTLASMQQEVLKFARGERHIFVRRVYLHKFFDEVRQQLAYQIDGRAIELELDVDTKVVAYFDEGRMLRAMLNLARNSIEAMAERGGRLTLCGRKEGTELVLRVSDTGPGIPKEIEGRIFQSFVTAGKEHGTGLGLAIVKKIVEEHGGRIDVRSTSKGAIFELRIPQTDHGSPPASQPAPIEPEPSKGGPEGNTTSSRKRRTPKKGS